MRPQSVWKMPPDFDGPGAGGNAAPSSNAATTAPTSALAAQQTPQTKAAAPVAVATTANVHATTTAPGLQQAKAATPVAAATAASARTAAPTSSGAAPTAASARTAPSTAATVHVAKADVVKPAPNQSSTRTAAGGSGAVAAFDPAGCVMACGETRKTDRSLTNSPLGEPAARHHDHFEDLRKYPWCVGDLRTGTIERTRVKPNKRRYHGVMSMNDAYALLSTREGARSSSLIDRHLFRCF